MPGFSIKSWWSEPEEHPDLYDETSPNHKFAVEEYNYNASNADDTDILLDEYKLSKDIPGTIPPPVKEDKRKRK